MIIDMHVRPALFSLICSDEESFERRCNEMNLHLMSPAAPDLLRAQYELAGLDHVVLLGDDTGADSGFAAISNEEVKRIVDAEGDGFYIGFASVDPRYEDAAERLEDAFGRLGLRGLYVNCAKLRMYPTDGRLDPLYQVCERLGRPIVFQAGLSLEANSVSRYCEPINFEEVALAHPTVKMCLSHLGWPWVEETAALLVKLPNLYADTSLMCMGSPVELFKKIFRQDFGRWWLDHDLANKLMFGSDSPRVRPVRIKHGLDVLEMDAQTRKKLYGENAAAFLGL